MTTFDMTLVLLHSLERQRDDFEESARESFVIADAMQGHADQYYAEAGKWELRAEELAEKVEAERERLSAPKVVA